MSADRVWELMGRKLSNEASAEELQELDHLLRTHSDLHFSVQTITDLWQQSSSPSEEELQGAYEQHLARMQQKGLEFNKEHHEPVTEPEWMVRGKGKKSVRLVKMYASVLGLLLIVTVLGYYIFTPLKPARIAFTDKSSSPNEIATEYGTRTTQQLPDGSRVWLNAGSKLVLHETFGKALREVTLTGEAFFDVVKNPEKPFVIHTSTIDVKVLGTQFNVKSYPTDKTTETSLLRGSVEVVVKKRPNEKYVLKPNEKLVVLNNVPDPENTGGNRSLSAARQLPKENLIAIKNLTYQKGDTADVESAWVRNKLSVKDEPFTEVARIMERWYDVRFEFRNKKVEDMFITGSFDNETLSQALEALKFSFAFNYEINDKTVIVY